jgi:hypothetical protein
MAFEYLKALHIIFVSHLVCRLILHCKIIYLSDRSALEKPEHEEKTVLSTATEPHGPKTLVWSLPGHLLSSP